METTSQATEGWPVHHHFDVRGKPPGTENVAWKNIWVAHKCSVGRTPLPCINGSIFRLRRAFRTGVRCSRHVFTEQPTRQNRQPSPGMPTIQGSVSWINCWKPASSDSPVSHLNQLWERDMAAFLHGCWGFLVGKLIFHFTAKYVLGVRDVRCCILVARFSIHVCPRVPYSYVGTSGVQLNSKWAQINYDHGIVMRTEGLSPWVTFHFGVPQLIITYFSGRLQ